MNFQTTKATVGTSLSRQLVQAIRARDIDAGTRKAAALFTLDAVANIVAGQNSVPGRKLVDWFSEISGDAPCDKARLSFFYGSLCHILEVDDLHRASVVHPGCIVVPAVMAMAAGRPGGEALTAIVQGFEACCRVGMSVGAEHYKIWHNTATCGPFGSAMATACLLGLSEDETVHCLGNAGSQSAGLWEFLDTGAETKHLHAGRGAEAGVVSAGLAQRGFTGAPHILEGARGFYAAACPDAQPELLVPGADEGWQLPLTSIKPWPSCRHTHPSIDCALTLHQKTGGHENIASVSVRAYPAALHLCDRKDVNSAYEGKFSLQHCVAAALRDGEVTFDSFEADARSALAPMREKISVATAEQFTKAYPVNWGSEIVVELKDGRSLTQATRDALGDPELPLNETQLVDKARMLLRHANHSDPDRLIGAVLAMETGGKVPDLWREMNPGVD